ncbi:unnamed protein product [Acanthoscelides obtectus]|uniref:MADF domain-containing protein n=1 Tax=Acanthoscelides obtectus TaxID=200917 RepID=A0A9P0MJQ5_ACAOB|nr:unnamed protein product [Acanthoscelides obtectus]CAK1671594.1 hypothetical protein AOBTE_LOCUS28349 [Acanthoscelides obtectus]
MATQKKKQQKHVRQIKFHNDSVSSNSYISIDYMESDDIDYVGDTEEVCLISKIIESKECLWDKTKEVSKDKVLRRNAWRDVCAFLEPNLEDMDQKNKDEINIGKFK